MTGTLLLNPGNLDLVTDPSAAASGSILKNGQRFLHNGGPFNNTNTFVGIDAGNFTMTGDGNTASGVSALANNTTGSLNTASGVDALANNTTGIANTASGFFVLFSNTTGTGNTANGQNALRLNTTGRDNTASGRDVLLDNTIGSFNTASGANALARNTTGTDNTATGVNALSNNTTGIFNTACGDNALGFNITGSNNIGIGGSAGAGIVGGGNNIDIGNQGSDESNTIRIGDVQTATFIAGINGATSSSGVAVFVNTSGQLGTLTSSARFKDDIRDLGEGSKGLLRLRPVSFRYKAEIDPTGLEQYGLVAEEVAKIYPDLVTRDDAGQPQAVRYHFLVPMLVNEVQRDRKTIGEQRLLLEDLNTRLARLEALLAGPAR